MGGSLSEERGKRARRSVDSSEVMDVTQQQEMRVGKVSCDALSVSREMSAKIVDMYAMQDRYRRHTEYEYEYEDENELDELEEEEEDEEEYESRSEENLYVCEEYDYYDQEQRAAL